MIPIAFTKIVESTVMQLPQVDLALGLGTIALVVSAFTFYISHTRASKNEQMKMSRCMWECINVKFDKIREIAETKGWDKSGHIDIPLKIVWPVVDEIDYFAYLILSGEIKDKVVLGYYKTRLSQYIESILKYYTPADNRYQLYEDYEHFDKLITKWEINRPDEEMT
jgi:hypothetical protein